MRSTADPARASPAIFDVAGEDGFTLVEMIVAMLIVTLLCGGAISAIRNATWQVAKAGNQAVALGVAQSLLEGAGVSAPLQIGETSGSAGERFRWRLSTRPYGSEIDWSANPIAVYEVGVKVAWGAAANPSSIALTTLRIGPKARPQ